jgi:hypothetical protein
MRLLVTVVGAFLLLIAGVANYLGWATYAPLTVIRRTIYLTLGGLELHFSVNWVLVGIPLFLFYVGLGFDPFQKAISSFRQRPRTAALLVAGLLLLVFSLLPWEYRSTPPEDCGSALGFYLLFALAGFTLVLLGAYPWLEFLERPAERVWNFLRQMKARWFMLLTAGFVLVAANVVSLFVFQHLPHIQDSIAQLFQARLFASGRLFLASPRFPDFFDQMQVINNGRWYSMYPPFHSVVLMLGVLLGMPWLVNPLLGALTVPAVYLLGREVYDERTARLGTLLMCLSPFVVNMSAEFMNHATTLLLIVFALLLFFRLLKQGRLGYALLLGLLLGLAADIRPLTALAVMLPFAGYVYLTSRDVAGATRRFGPALATLTVSVALMLAYNWRVNGDPLLFGYVVRWGPGHEIGFGHSVAVTAHTPLRGLVNTGNNLIGLNRYLFEWPFPNLVPIVVLLLSGMAVTSDWLLFSGFFAVVAAYFFYWYQDLCFGPRFLYETAGLLVLLTARGMQAVGPLLRNRLSLAVSDDSVRRWFLRAGPLVLFVTLVIGIPPLYLRKYRSYYHVDAALLRTVQDRRLRNAVVFCQDLDNAYNANPLGRNGPVVYAQDYGVLNAALTLDYPGRNYFYGSGDTLLQIPQVAFDRSELKQTLSQFAALLRANTPPDCRTIIWPFKDLPPPDGLVPGCTLTDFRDLSDAVFSGTGRIEDYLPALACWVFDDHRLHVTGFDFMNDRESFLLGEVRFTLLRETDNHLGAIYDIRPATGHETIKTDD